MNLKAILDEKGADFSQVVKVTAHLQDINQQIKFTG